MTLVGLRDQNLTLIMWTSGVFAKRLIHVTNFFRIYVKEVAKSNLGSRTAIRDAATTQIPTGSRCPSSDSQTFTAWFFPPWDLCQSVEVFCNIPTCLRENIHHNWPKLHLHIEQPNSHSSLTFSPDLTVFIYICILKNSTWRVALLTHSRRSTTPTVDSNEHKVRI